MKHTRSNIPVNSKSWNDSKDGQKTGEGTTGESKDLSDGLGPVEGGSGGMMTVLDESELIIDGSTEGGKNDAGNRSDAANDFKN